MSDLLLEIGTEEIPAKFMPPALAELAKLTKEKLDEQVAREEQKKQQHEQTMGGL